MMRPRTMPIVLLLAVAPTLRAQSAAPRVPVAAWAADSAAAIRPGDVIRLSVWREPEFSGDFVVDETGVAVLPKIGPTRVGAASPAAVRARLVAAYGRIVNHDVIGVTVLRRIQVLGAVRNPGLYPADPTMTLSDVIAQAGGITSTGNAGHLQLVRDGKRVSGDIAAHALIGNLPVRSGDQIYVPERSWISRSPAVVAASLSAIATVTTILLTRSH